MIDLPPPSFWETPRGVWLIVAISALVAAPIGFMFGYTLSSTPQHIIVHVDQPIIVKMQ